MVFDMLFSVQRELHGLRPECVSMWSSTGLNGVRVFDLQQLPHGRRRAIWILVSLPYLCGFLVHDLKCLLQSFRPARVNIIWSLTDLNGGRVVDLQQLLQDFRPVLVMFVPLPYLSDFTVCDLQRLLQRLGSAIWAFPSSTCQSGVTVRHKILDTVLNTAFEKGDLSSRTCRYYCAIAEMRHNLYTNSQGITPFEVVTGETPRTPHNFMMIPTNADLRELNVTPLDREFIEKLRDEIRDLIVWIHFRDDERLHTEKAHRLTQEYNRRKKIFEYRIGDLVSFQGQMATIRELIQPTVKGPAKVRIQITNHESSNDKVVMYADLLPLGIAYPELMVNPASITIEPGHFCFFQIPSATMTVFVVPGMILGADYDTQMCTVHRYQQVERPKNKFMPMWAPIEGSIPYRGRRIARASKVKERLPDSVVVPYQDIILTTTLDANNRLDDAILRSLVNKGIMP